MLVKCWSLLSEQQEILWELYRSYFLVKKRIIFVWENCAYCLSSCLGAACGINYRAYNSKKYVDICKTIFLFHSKVYLLL